MYNVIIADDERLIRQGLEKHVPWGQFDMQVTGLAEDGVQALQMIKEQPCDLLVTDIRMPRMDGFALVEEVIEMGERPLVILVTSYDDFAYAQRAISLHLVRDYILKPIDTDKFAALLQEIQGELAMRKNQLVAETILLEDYKTLLTVVAEASYDRSKMLEYIKQGDVTRAVVMWKSVAAAIRGGNVATATVKRFCSNVVMAVLTNNLLSAPGNGDEQGDPLKAVYGVDDQETLLALTEEFIFTSCQTARRGLYGGRSKLIQQACQLCDQNFQSADFNLTGLAARLNVTPSYLSVKFKEETGTGFMRYLIDKRLDAAKNLLATTGKKVYEVGREVGFEDEKYFARLFKKNVGDTPRAYREKNDREL